MSKKVMDDMESLAKKYNPFKNSGGGSSFKGSSNTSGTKAEDAEKKKQRLAALESGRGKPGGGTDMAAMRAEILREREKRRAVAGDGAGGAGGSSINSGSVNSTLPETDPARVAIETAVATINAIADADADADAKTNLITTLCKIAANALDDAFGDSAFVFSNPENAYENATETEKVMAVTRADKRSVKLGNVKIAALFTARGALDAFLAAGFVVEKDDSTDVSGSVEVDIDTRRLTLPHTAHVTRVNFLVQKLATLCSAALPSAERTARVADPRFRKKRTVDPKAPPIGGRGAKAFRPALTKAKTATLDDSFFKRDASEVAADFETAKAKREQSSFLSTKAWKNANFKNTGDDDESAEDKKHQPVVVRVRMPDGTQLLGRFGPREPIAAVRTFVSEHLREPFRSFGLSFLGSALVGDEDDPGNAKDTSNKPRDSLTGLRTHNVRDTTNPNWKHKTNVGFKGLGYGTEGTVVGAGLAPSALITFAWADKATKGVNTDGNPAVLNENILRDAVALEG